MKPLRDYKVSKGKVAGRVRLKLESADGEWQGWLSPKQAERLAADIFSIRFDAPMLEVILQIQTTTASLHHVPSRAKAAGKAIVVFGAIT
jgi:hypothetical protein